MNEDAIKSEEKADRDEEGHFLPGHNIVSPGRPKGSFSLKTLLTEEIQKQPEGQQLSYALALVKKQLKQAIIDGDQQTQKLIWNYLEGLPHQPVDMGLSGEIKHFHITIGEDDKDKPLPAPLESETNPAG